MKRKIAGILAALLAFMCVACGQQVTQESEEASQDAVVESQTENRELSEPVSDTLVTKQDESKCYNCIVQVQTDNQRGSGVLWDKQEECWIFVTAAHVVEGLEDAEIYFAEFDQICAAEVICVEGLDLAFLQLDTNVITTELAEGYEECLTMQEEKDVANEAQPTASTEVKRGDMISAMGYNAAAERLEYEGIVYEPWIYVEDFENYMFLCECEAQAGMSGGGVFTRSGELAGIICGQNEEGLLAVLPVEVIRTEYSCNCL